MSSAPEQPPLYLQGLQFDARTFAEGTREASGHCSTCSDFLPIFMRKNRAFCDLCWSTYLCNRMKMREWLGLTVEFRVQTITRGGVVFKEGEHAVVDHHYRGGLSLKTPDNRSILKVNRMHVRIVYPQPAAAPGGSHG